MTNKSKEKGSRYEKAVADYLKSCGYTEVARQRGTGTLDQGDLAGLRHWVVECKDHGHPQWWDFVRQANVEATNAGKPFGVAIQKKRNASVEDSIVMMDLKTWVEVLDHIENLGGRA